MRRVVLGDDNLQPDEEQPRLIRRRSVIPAEPFGFAGVRLLTLCPLYHLYFVTLQSVDETGRYTLFGFQHFDDNVLPPALRYGQASLSQPGQVAAPFGFAGVGLCPACIQNPNRQWVFCERCRLLTHVTERQYSGLEIVKCELCGHEKRGPFSIATSATPMADRKKK